MHLTQVMIPRADETCRGVSRLLLTSLLFLSSASLSADLMLSGNEGKINLTSGTPVVVADPTPDSITLLDFSDFPPNVRHLRNIPNSVIGPPSNIAIAPDHSFALIADSIRIDPDDPTAFVPASRIHVLDLRTRPPRVARQVTVGGQPSGMSITPDGRLALVANRAEGTVSVLDLEAGGSVSPRVSQTLTVCAPEESVSDVAIGPKGKMALASIQKGGYLQMLRITDKEVVVTDRKFSVYGQPYRCVITPDGELGLTAGMGTGSGGDVDALTVIDLTAEPPRTVDFVPVGAVPESIEVSPDGKMVVAVVMAGSNLPTTDPGYRPEGGLTVLWRKGATYEKTQELATGAIPEGVAFSTDGRYVVVQCHPERQLRVYAVKGKKLKDTGVRIDVPGMPSSLRAAP